LLSFLLSSIWVSGGIETNVPSMPWLMASAVTTLQTCSALLNIADLDGRPDSVKVSLRRDDSGGDADDMASQFEGMDMSSRQARSKPLIGPTISPLHYAVQQGLFASSIVDPEGEDNDMSADAIAARNSLAALHAVFAEATHTGSTPLPALTPTLARLTCGLVQAGFAEAARLIVETLPPALASAYIKGGIALAHGPQNAAVSFFNKVCSALRSPDILAEDISGLITILPPQVTAKAPGEHSVALLSKHLCHLFSVAPFTEAVAYFGAQAIQKGIDSALAHDSNAAQEVWFRTFRAQLDLWDFKSAYRTIMMSEDDQFRRDCIRSLVTAMCEAGEVSTLLHYNFSGLQGEIERSLSFKARNSDPFGRPNYFKILYAYHMHRGDLKSGTCQELPVPVSCLLMICFLVTAGAVMYQQSHQLAELQRMGYHIAVNKGSDYEEFVDIASVQARSFLAAMNVLNLVDKQDAWFPYAHPTAGGAVDEQDEMQMSQEHQQESIFNDIARQKRAYTKCRTTHYIPSSEFAPECKEIEILELDDIKREYQLLLARLDLAKGYTELTAPRSKLSAFDAVALYLRSDQYDKAVSAARALDVDMTAIFQNLATKCTSLTRRAAAWKTELSASAASNHDEKKKGTGAAIHPSLQKLQEEIDSQEDPDAAFLLYSERSSSWTGSPSDKAWRYLRLQLEMNDEETAEGRGGDAGAGGKYRIVVLNRILDLGAEVFLPEWLVEWFRVRPSEGEGRD
jgi:nuclear pore complex protein Nup160